MIVAALEVKLNVMERVERYIYISFSSQLFKVVKSEM